MSRVFLRSIRQLLSSYYALMLEYRAETMLWVLANILPFIQMGVWMRASAQADLAFSQTDFARYFLAVFIVRQFTVVWVIWEFEFYVVEGRLSSYLLRPIDPVWHFVAMHLGEQLTRLPFWLVVVGTFFLLYPQALWMPNPASLAAAALAIALAFTLRFVLQYTFALLSFWIERASNIEQISFLPYLFLSGLVAPLELFPPAVRTVAEWTPFPYLIYFPAKLLVSQQLDLRNWAGSLAIMLGWITLLLILNRILWYRGLRHYSGMGA